MPGVLTIDGEAFALFDARVITIGSNIVVDFEPVGPGEQAIILHDGVMVGGEPITNNAQQKVIVAREFDCKTICIDSWSSAFDYLINKCKDEGLDGFDLWGAVFERGASALRAVIDTARPDPYNPDRRSYNVVASVHEQMETDKKGNTIAIVPAIGGQSRTRIGRIFNTVLACMSETDFDDDGKAFQNYYCYSTPPDNLRACGDGVGGGGGKYNELPYKVSGTYPALMDAWGRPKEEDDEE